MEWVGRSCRAYCTTQVAECLQIELAKLRYSPLDLWAVSAKDSGVVNRFRDVASLLHAFSGAISHGSFVMITVGDLVDEFRDCDFGDARLAKRVMEMASVLGNNPNLSITTAFKTKAEFEACYRFFDNEKVSPEKTLESHIRATRERIRQCDYVLLVQDTTEIDLTRPKQQVEGAGPMDHDCRRGAFYHPLVAFTATGLPLGIVRHKNWTRTELSKASKSDKSAARKQTPIEEKESYRWLEGLHSAEITAATCPDTTCVCVGDSESDIYDLFAYTLASEQPNLKILVRAGQRRVTADDEDWTEQVRKTIKIGGQSINVGARTAKIGKGKTARSRSREARTADLEIRKATIELRRPVDCDNRLPSTIEVNLVLCEEVSPPEGEDAISWLLVTTLPIDSDEDVQRVIESYCRRWQIEIFFKVLKSGCKIEYRRFENIDRILNCLAFYSVIAWRLMYICHMGRECPDIECEVMFEPSEWKSVYAVLGIEMPKVGCPTLNELIRAIARLGGFVDRPKNQPGPKTLWTGLQRCYDLSNAWNAFGPGSKKFSTD